ncbi:exodeoxyribonuclease VII large subunit [Pueribacillus theae]|uniref:Exodeoxyribonuclease 7 large subunit n=1 Tax=Pueribacillus theae TaxID=2171751 RepID=A0A2U1K6Q0_9BACI|nr:exodeoxyribonuclease VII large subunit [Pueribacillus theae]PWA13211.1 exodeoxyribonuclease VII large subunit [Pueribacillus theae]
MEQDRYLSITALTRYIKRQFDRDTVLNDVWVRGELSNVKLHSRGHMYFTLKDERSRIQSVMFSSHNSKLAFRPENGMKVLVRGEVTVYEPYGQYQLYAKEMQPDGIGNLFLAFEELKKKLEREGIFSSERKKPLPVFPVEIGVVTSKTGAAVRDIFTTIKRRYPLARITLFPVYVQGELASESIAKAIKQANELRMHDVLIVGRGGGSIEDLWPFNEEIVARSIFHSEIPIISAVGHETDVTIADFAADVRAATPTAAAELAVPHVLELNERVNERKARLIRAIAARLDAEREKLARLQKSYAFRYPAQLIRQKNQELDRLIERLTREAKLQLNQKYEQWRNINKSIHRHHPEKLIIQGKERRKQLTKRLAREMQQLTNRKKMLYQQSISKLDALSPLKVMDRGYSLVTKDDVVVKSVYDVNPGDMIQVNVKDGLLDCHVWGLEESKNEP